MMSDFNNPLLAWDDLPKIESVKFVQLAVNYKWLAMFRALLGSLSLFVIWLIVAIIARFWSWKIWLWVLLGFTLWTIFSVFRAYMVYKYKGYAIRNHDVLYRSGWLWKSLVVVPFARIQHVEIKRGPVEELLHLRTLSIYTAGGTSADLAFSGLSPEQAEGLQALILEKTGLNEEE